MSARISMLRLLIAVLLAVGIPPSDDGLRTCAAACRVKTESVATASAAASVVATSAVVQAEVVAVPVAVGVGVPVAQQAPYYYSYSAYAQSSPPPVDLDALAAKVVERLRASGPPSTHPTSPESKLEANRTTNSRPVVEKTAPQSLIAERCAVCHSGPETKGQLNLENPSALDCSSRLKGIRAVLSERMPKGGPRLTPEEAGRVLEELVGP